jgi:putative salt-induced outer membrane protein
MFVSFLLLTLMVEPGRDAVQIADELEFFHERETALFQAIHDRDRDALDALLAPEYVLRGSPDVPREEWLKNAVAMCWGRAAIADFHVRRHEATAVVSFVLTFDQDPATCQPALLRSLITDVWHERDGRWQLAVRHSGPPGDGRGIAAQFSVVPRVPPVFEAKAELSMVSTGGNTSTRTIGAAADAIHRGRRTTTSGRIAFVRSVTDDLENARSLIATARQGWQLSSRTEGFARGEYLRDLFAGVEHRATGEGGVSFSPSAAPHALRIDVGIGGTTETRIAADDRRFAGASATVAYRWTPAPVSELVAESSVTADLQRGENWRSANSVSLLVVMNRIISARVAYTLRYLNDPVPGFRRTDTTASMAIVLSYARQGS